MLLLALPSSTRFLDLFLNNVWLAIAFWAGLSGLDYVFAIIQSRLYRDGAHQHYSFKGGVEFNPFMRKDVADYRFRFFLFFFFMAGALFITRALDLPEGFAVLWGMVIGVQLVHLCRHIRNLTLLTYGRKSAGISGNIQYEHWYLLRQSAVDYLGFSLLFLVLFTFWGHFVVLGATLGCFSIGLQHLGGSAKARKSPPEN